MKIYNTKSIPGRKEQLLVIEQAPKPKDSFKSIKYMIDNPIEIKDLIRKSEEPNYLYWDKLKYKDWLPKNISKEDFWQIVKLNRLANSKVTKINDKDSKPFLWNKLNKFDKMLHEIDLNLSSMLTQSEGYLNLGIKKKFFAKGIIEEAIASSQIEGAHTTRKAAKEMIRNNIEPKKKAEKMIVNNYEFIDRLKDEFCKEKLSLNLLSSMHETITKGTLKESHLEGFIRNHNEILIAPDETRQDVISHIPPDHSQLEAELSKLISFANDELEEEDFVHPIIKAIKLHFWLAYLHPYEDGNGRLARGLFYWYLFKRRYWLLAYIPISTRIKRTTRQYAQSYIYSEQDDNDLTYFIEYQLEIIYKAMNDFIENLEKSSKKSKKLKELANSKYELNLRQIELVDYLIENSSGKNLEITTVTEHQNTYNISAGTAVKDLQDLYTKKLLSNKKSGKYVHYFLTEKGKKLFEH